MPTKLDRVQVLFNKGLFQKLKLIAKIQRRSLSSMVSSIVQDAFESPKYKSLLSRAAANDLQLKVDEIKLLIQEILEINGAREIDFEANLKLKEINKILSSISKSKEDYIDDPSAQDILVSDILAPKTELKEIDLIHGEKLKKLRTMLTRIKNSPVNN